MQNIVQTDSANKEDPFLILKDHRKKFIRPKAKYVRKVPLPPRNPKKVKPDSKPIEPEYKNARKMTADSDIELDIEYSEADVKRQVQPTADEPIPAEPENSFFDDGFLDFVMPLQSKKITKENSAVDFEGEANFIDFFDEE